MVVFDEMRPVSVLTMVILKILAILVHAAVANVLLLEDDTLLCSRTDPEMDPFYEIRYGQDVVWQIPPNPKAVLFLAHGMNKEPLSYFDPGPNCGICYGFPEDRAVVLEALRRSYAVIVVKSVGAYWLPWNVESWPPPTSQDREIVRNVINEWTREHSLDHLPLAAFGHSSGGNFSTLLTLQLDIKSLILMCTPGEFEVLKHANALFPPTLFVPMPFDNVSYGFYPMVLKAVGILKSRGALVGQFDAWPRPIYPLYFTEKIPCLAEATSVKIYAAYKAEGWLDDNDYVIKNPRLWDWEAVLVKHKTLPFCNSWNELCLAQHVEQELMTAYAEHSLTSWANDPIYNWLDYTVFPGSSEPTRFVASL